MAGSSSKIKNRIAKKKKNRIAADEWVNRTWFIHGMGYHAALTRTDSLTQETV